MLSNELHCIRIEVFCRNVAIQRSGGLLKAIKKRIFTECTFTDQTPNNVFIFINLEAFKELFIKKTFTFICIFFNYHLFIFIQIVFKY